MAEDVLGQALALSEALLEAAREGDFERLEALEGRRRDLLRRIPALVRPADGKAEILHRIQELDRSTMALLERERDEAAKALTALRRGRRAARVYGAD